MKYPPLFHWSYVTTSNNNVTYSKSTIIHSIHCIPKNHDDEYNILNFTETMDTVRIEINKTEKKIAFCLNMKITTSTLVFLFLLVQNNITLPHCSLSFNLHNSLSHIFRYHTNPIHHSSLIICPTQHKVLPKQVFPQNELCCS